MVLIDGKIISRRSYEFSRLLLGSGPTDQLPLDMPSAVSSKCNRPIGG